uniref:ADAM metallopeptidase domain 28 n=1 Tax=Anabas testudineus TaxID=64144 RepID=A0A7N6A2W0_ANATE
MTRTLLLWVLILNASVKPSESHGNVFEEVKDYEVVRPVRLHTVRKRHAEHLRPDTLRYAITVGGKDIEMQLEKNFELLTKDYTETYYRDDGERVTTRPNDIDHCYYHGRIVNDSKSSVSISTCDGLRTFIALVGLEIWSSRDLINVTPPAGANLDAFMNWRNNDLLKRKPNDNAHLISGIDFEGATVGLAFIGTLCSGHSVGVIQDHNDQAIAVGATLAHEMGHNLGMDHDDSSTCICSADSCIMAAALSWNIPRTFSSCSTSNYEKYLTSRSPSCILDKPDFRSIVAPAVCGNGFVEAGEQCDCGTVEECKNPCCNATTCTYKDGSQCADGECCNNCKISPRSQMCREKQDECDLAEYCDGKSATCPEDVFAVNGLPCEGGLGYCYNGKCPQRPNQCIRMYGPSAREAPASCYSHNTRGVYYAFCTRPSKDQFIPCQDIFCGKLFCSDGNDSPNYGRMVRVNTCKATFFEDYTQDYGQVDSGTKCGDGKVCSQNQCVELETAYRNTNCSAKCPGNAVSTC